MRSTRSKRNPMYRSIPYHKKQSKTRTPRWKGFVYKEQFLSPDDFTIITNECNSLHQSLLAYKEQDENVLRYNMPIQSPIIHSILTRYTPVIRRITGNPRLYLATNFPIEYRKYGKGSFMAMHRDTQLYRIPQYECILTIYNTSDSITNFYTKHITSIMSSPNSISMVRANGIEPEVEETTIGERYFLKFIFTETDEML